MLTDHLVAYSRRVETTRSTREARRCRGRADAREPHSSAVRLLAELPDVPGIRTFALGVGDQGVVVHVMLPSAWLTRAASSTAVVPG